MNPPPVFLNPNSLIFIQLGYWDLVISYSFYSLYLVMALSRIAWGIVTP
jgi:hypothetical protein